MTVSIFVIPRLDRGIQASLAAAALLALDGPVKPRFNRGTGHDGEKKDAPSRRLRRAFARRGA